jgi:hypothetical protein
MNLSIPETVSLAANPTAYTIIQFFIGVTNSPTDLKRTALALRVAKTAGPETYDIVLAHALAGRKQWRIEQTRLQRRWQRETRRASRARHHDSVSIRERYVRCA